MLCAPTKIERCRSDSEETQTHQKRQSSLARPKARAPANKVEAKRSRRQAAAQKKDDLLERDAHQAPPIQRRRARARDQKNHPAWGSSAPPQAAPTRGSARQCRTDSHHGEARRTGQASTKTQERREQGASVEGEEEDRLRLARRTLLKEQRLVVLSRDRRS